ncbi:MAG: hypothetical protein HC796_12050 [Synechococcaceae cyanobacterium RL_1_2]|nr:hypothetical protein [Synechococcaceae cyanobacterium RL_1_2]
MSLILLLVIGLIVVVIVQRSRTVVRIKDNTGERVLFLRWSLIKFQIHGAISMVKQNPF